MRVTTSGAVLLAGAAFLSLPALASANIGAPFISCAGAGAHLTHFDGKIPLQGVLEVDGQVYGPTIAYVPPAGASDTPVLLLPQDGTAHVSVFTATWPGHSVSATFKGSCGTPTPPLPPAPSPPPPASALPPTLPASASPSGDSASPAAPEVAPWSPPPPAPPAFPRTHHPNPRPQRRIVCRAGYRKVPGRFVVRYGRTIPVRGSAVCVRIHKLIAVTG
jgi:hypothetical protein